MIDVNAIRGEVSLTETAQRFGIKLERAGQDFEACCPFHAESTASFTVFRGERDGVERFHCFGCGKHGDIIDFVMLLKGVDTVEALEILNGGPGPENIKPKHLMSNQLRDVYAGIEIVLDHKLPPILPRQEVPLYNPKTEKTWKIKPSLVHPYANGGFVLRHDLKDDKGKETPMVMPVRLPSGSVVWSRFPFPKPRPIYGIERLKDDKQVTLVEGEKCADALFASFGLPVCSWAGGGNSLEHTDWAPLYGRKILIWPDNDGPGLSAGKRLARILQKNGSTVRIVDNTRAAA